MWHGGGAMDARHGNHEQSTPSVTTCFYNTPITHFFQMIKNPFPPSISWLIPILAPGQLQLLHYQSTICRPGSITTYITRVPFIRHSICAYAKTHIHMYMHIWTHLSLALQPESMFSYSTVDYKSPAGRGQRTYLVQQRSVLYLLPITCNEWPLILVLWKTFLLPTLQIMHIVIL